MIEKKEGDLAKESAIKNYKMQIIEKTDICQPENKA